MTRSAMTAPLPEGEGRLAYLPLFLDIADRAALVLGGDAAAAAKARLLRRCGARVQVVSPTVGEDMAELIRGGVVAWQRRTFVRADLDQVAVVFDAGGDSALTARVRTLARERNIPFNAVDRPQHCDFVVPAILERGPVVVAISTGGAAPALARILRQRLERALPAGVGRLARAAAACRDAVKRALPAGAARLRFWERALADLDDHDGSVAEMVDSLTARLAAPPEVTGRVDLVGAGPGDAGLLTLQAARALERADIVLYDALVGPEILSLTRRDARLVAVGKRAGGISTPQRLVNRMMVAHARRGLRVVRLKGGDPFVFGRGGEEAAYMRRHGIEVRILPGMTTALGCAAAAGIPLTHRGVARRLHLVTAACRSDAETAALDWRGLARAGGTLAVYMGRERIDQIARGLIAGGLAADTPAVAIENGTRPGARHCFAPLDTLAAASTRTLGQGPVLLIIGAVVAEAPAWPAAQPAAQRA